MPLILPGNVGSATAATDFNVSNSLRFNDGDSPALTRSLGASETSTQKGTFSFWVKRGQLTTAQMIYTNEVADDNNRGQILFEDDDTFMIRDTVSGSNTTLYATTQLFRDTSAWYHMVVALDSTASAGERITVFKNGTRIPDAQFGTSTEPSQNANFNILTGGQTNKNHIGKVHGGSNHFDGYLAEFVYCDGQVLDADSFGEFDSDSPTIWKPKDVSGLTFGANGFYLDFEDSSALGNDKAGSNNFGTVTNLAAIDQSTDTCTNNFATMNSIDNLAAGSAFSEGNLKIVTTSGNITYNTSTIGFSSGKWYMETKLAGSAGYTVGVVRGVSTANDNDNKLGNRADGWSYDDGGDVEHNGGSLTGSFASYSSGDIIGVYADLDNNELYFSKDGALQNSGTGLALTAGTYFFAVGDNNASNSSTYEVNFGGTNTYSVSSGNTDGTYGNFEYSTTITGDGASKTFKALNTKNLAEYGG